MSLEKAVACVRKNKSFLITAHTNLEGDALGSEIAFYHLVRYLGKRAVIVNDDAIPYGYDFFPEAKIIKKFNRHKIDFSFDCFAILDCSDLSRCAEVGKIGLKQKTVLNIDHHISNENFADVNWIDPHASSCAEMIYRLYKKMRVPIKRNAALALYVGMLTDTGSFRYSNTSRAVHQAVAELMRFGLNAREIYRTIYENVPFSDMQLLTKILSTMQGASMERIVWFQVRHSVLEGKRLSLDLSEQLLTFARMIKGVEVVAVFKENLGELDQVRVNLRSQGKVDVNKIAQVFGGGGHKTASGITMRGDIENVKKKVLGKIKEAVDKL